MVNTILRYSSGGRGNDGRRIRSTKGRQSKTGPRKWVRSQTGTKSNYPQGNNHMRKSSWRRHQEKEGHNKKESQRDKSMEQPLPTTLDVAPSLTSISTFEDEDNSKESQETETMQKYGKNKLVLLKSNKTARESKHTMLLNSNGRMKRRDPLEQAKESEETLRSSEQNEPSFGLTLQNPHDLGDKHDSIGQKRMVHQGSNKLVLSESLRVSKNTLTSLSSKEPKEAALESIQKKEQLESVSSSFMKRRGTHKLVLDKMKRVVSVDTSEESSVKPIAMASKDSSLSAPEAHQSQSTVPSHRSSQEVNLMPTQETPTGQERREKDMQGKKVVNMVHRGANRLVLCCPKKTIQGMAEKSTSWTNSKLKRRLGTHRRQPYRTSNDSKRIKLVHSVVSDKSECDGNLVNQPKLTDHAYRETSKSTRHKPGLKNMGLVRVQSNQSTTPICRTILRGMPCQNEHCKLRHDIPREHAMPVCSFFQKDGHCLRGTECPFRHVRVNPRAMICPTFALLSYCDDKDCVMQHIHPKRKFPTEVDSDRARR